MPAWTRCSREGNRFFRRKLTVLSVTCGNFFSYCMYLFIGKYFFHFISSFLQGKSVNIYIDEHPLKEIMQSKLSFSNNLHIIYMHILLVHTVDVSDYSLYRYSPWDVLQFFLYNTQWIEQFKAEFNGSETIDRILLNWFIHYVL